MWEGKYAKEPMDMRLLVLRFVKKIWIVLTAAVLGTLIAGGIYIGTKVIGPFRQYQAQSMYFIEFATDPRLDDAYSYYNDYTWNVWISTDEFVNRIQSKLKTEMTDAKLRQYLAADLPADLRMPVSIITTPDEELTMEIVKAAEQTFMEMPEFQREIETVRVVESPDEAVLVTGGGEVFRVCLLSFLGCFLSASVVLLWYLIWDTSIYLPSTFRRRYGIPVLGTVESADLKVNYEYLLSGAGSIALTSVMGETDLSAVKEILLSKMDISECESPKVITCVPALMQCPEAAEKLRKADGVILTVEAGRRSGKQIEYTLELMEKQDIRVSAALLWEADEALIKGYYFGNKKDG